MSTTIIVAMDKFLFRLEEVCGTRSVAEFARLLGVRQQTLNNYMNGREPPAAFVALVCKTMNVSADWLLGLTDNNERGGDDNKWRSAALTSQRKLDKVNEALGKIIEGTKALQEAVK